MSPSSSSNASQHSKPAPERFATTRWSIVAAAGQRDAGDARTALTTLCESYWYPVYAFIRRQGYSPPDAEDCTQAFFAALLDKGYVKSADRTLGRFRTFLLTTVTRFLSKDRERHRAQKRGGGKKPLSIDAAFAEGRYRLEPADTWTPERIYERGWALALLDRVVIQLGNRYAEQGKQELFDRLKVFLTGGSPAELHTGLAVQLDMTAGALKVAVHRLRQRYRELLKAEIAQTLADPDDVADELELLLAALRGGAGK
ncbi:MAG TPA: sigma-70 family RNA polymerase sigma factor [Planctomycetaceae bacterium]|jgi:RNA polymerase sigma-70 factor (ECF subfamily)